MQNKDDLVAFEFVKDEILGKRGTINRERYEMELSLELLGLKIRQLRRAKDLTQEEFGKLIGVKKSQVSKIENGKQNITIETLLKIIEALDGKIKLTIETGAFSSVSKKPA